MRITRQPVFDEPARALTRAGGKQVVGLPTVAAARRERLSVQSTVSGLRGTWGGRKGGEEPVITRLAWFLSPLGRSIQFVSS